MDVGKAITAAMQQQRNDDLRVIQLLALRRAGQIMTELLASIDRLKASQGWDW